MSLRRHRAGCAGLVVNPLLYQLSYQAEGADYRAGGSALRPQLRLLRERSTPSCLSLR